MNDKELLQYILKLLKQATSTPENKEEFINKVVELLKSRVGNIKQSIVNENFTNPDYVKSLLRIFNGLVNKGYTDEQIYPYLRKEYKLSKDDYNYLLSRYQQEINLYQGNRDINNLYNKILKIYNNIDAYGDKERNKLFQQLLKQFDPSSTEEQLTDEQDYETEAVRTENVTKGDIFQYKGELYVVDKTQRGLLRLVELYSGTPVRLNTENLSKIDILTEKSIRQVLDSFIEDKATDKLPEIIKNQYSDYITKKSMNTKTIKSKLDKLSLEVGTGVFPLDDNKDLLWKIETLIRRNLRRFIVDVKDYDNFETECERVAQLIIDEIKK